MPLNNSNNKVNSKRIIKKINNLSCLSINNKHNPNKALVRLSSNKQAPSKT